MLLAWSSNLVQVQTCYFYRYWVTLESGLDQNLLSPSCRRCRFSYSHWSCIDARGLSFFCIKGGSSFGPLGSATWPKRVSRKPVTDPVYRAERVKISQNHDWCPVDLWGNKCHEWFCPWDLHHHKSVWNGFIPAHETGVSYGSRPGWVPLPKHFDVIWWS